jgi:hypothetical protein
VLVKHLFLRASGGVRKTGKTVRWTDAGRPAGRLSAPTRKAFSADKKVVIAAAMPIYSKARAWPPEVFDRRIQTDSKHTLTGSPLTSEA